jgi:hypothetical protein
MADELTWVVEIVAKVLVDIEASGDTEIADELPSVAETALGTDVVAMTSVVETVADAEVEAVLLPLSKADATP